MARCPPDTVARAPENRSDRASPSPLRARASSASTALVDRATRDIRAILARTLARGMDEIGTYLLDTFYRGDPDEYRSPTSPRHLSLRVLAERCGTIDLPVSITFLSTSLRIAALGRALPASSAFTKLPMSHRVELLRLPEPAVEATAAKALAEAMSVRTLREEVTATLASAPADPDEPAKRRGRKPAPEIVKLVKGLDRLITTSPAASTRKKDLGHLSRAQRTELRDALARAERQLAELRELLEE